MNNAVQAIYDWQVAAGNAYKQYDDFLESSFQVEEALEGFDVSALGALLNTTIYNHKEVSRSIVDAAINCQTTIEPMRPSDVDRLDKACDAVVFAIGSMAKLGLNADEITEALLIVNDANQQKLSAKRDAAGKLGKPADFVGPETKLQQLLDNRICLKEINEKNI